MEELAVAGAITGVGHERYSDGKWSRKSAAVPSEMSLTLYLNGQELVTILCTPTKLNCLILGFLCSEGIITGVQDVAFMRVCQEDSMAEVRLKNREFTPPPRRTLTSGCGGGVSFAPQGQRIDSNLRVPPEQILSLMGQLQERAELFRFCGGVHTSALADPENILIVAEDIGRHNTLDKLLGECLLTGQSTRDRVLLTTGRLSSEMLLKAARMATPLVASRNSPTERAISLARELGLTLVGYVRGGRLSVYSHPERIAPAP